VPPLSPLKESILGNVLRWRGASDFKWLFLVNPVQQVLFIPDDGNIRCFETLCFVQNTKTVDTVQKLITVKLILWSRILHYPQFYALLCVLGQVYIRTRVPRFYSILYGSHKNVKFEFYCNYNCVSLFISATICATLYCRLRCSPTGSLFSPWMHQLQWSVLLCVDNIYLTATAGTGSALQTSYLVPWKYPVS